MQEIIMMPQVNDESLINHLMVSHTIKSPIDTQSRSVFKAVTWRITGSVDTIVLAFLFTSDLTVATSIGLAEVFTKMILYYVHERAWNRIPIGKL